MAKRKVVQIAVRSPSADFNPVLYALCDDGSIWSICDGVSYVWEKVPGVPQDTTPKPARAAGQEDGR